MSVENRLEEWLNKMGYDGEIPKSLNKICNPSTAFIWEQITSRIKPREEVANLRRNIIISRLKNKSLEQQDEFSFPIKEIQAYKKRQELEKRIRFLENTIEEKEGMIDDLLSKNKKTYVAIDNLKQKIKENDERKYLLEKKSEMFEDDIVQAQEVLTLARNLTPVEMEESTNGNEITETLQKCALKLEALAKEVSLPNNTLKINTLKSLSASKMRINESSKSLSENGSFLKYINNCKTLTNTGSQKKGNSNKRNTFMHNNHHHNKHLNTLKETVELDNECKRPQKRESLGLLPELYLDLADEFDDVFLLTTNGIKSPNTKHSENLNSSIVLLDKTHCEIIEKLSNDLFVKEVLKNLLYKSNRQLILKNCEDIYEGLLSEIQNSAWQCSSVVRMNNDVNKDDLNELHFIHIKNEMEKDKYHVTLKKLQETIKRRKEEIYSALTMRLKNSAGEMKRRFDLQTKEVELVAANNFLHKKINATKKSEFNNELQLLSVKINQAEDEIVHKIEDIQNLNENIYKILKYIKNNREETSSYIRTLGTCIYDISWASRLTEELNLSETKTFKHFPVEYNRQLKHNELKIYHRNICSSTLPANMDLDSDNLQMIVTLMDTPFFSAETIVANMLQSKLKLNVLRSLNSDSVKLDTQSYSAEDLSNGEKYIESVISQLNTTVNSTSVKEVLSSPHYMNEVANLWLEMPLRNFISEKRLVDGHDYKFYENIFDSYYKDY